MSWCVNGTITGTNTYPDCHLHGTMADCNTDVCCYWRIPPYSDCQTKACSNLDNPDECPGCNRCQDMGALGYWGWEIDDDRGSMPWDITVDGATSIQATSNGKLSIGSGRILTTGALMAEFGGPVTAATLHMLPGSKIYIVGCSFPYPP